MVLKYVCPIDGTEWSISEDDYCPKCEARAEPALMLKEMLKRK